MLNWAVTAPAGEMCYAAHLSFGPDGYIDGTIEEQTRQTMENIKGSIENLPAEELSDERSRNLYALAAGPNVSCWLTTVLTAPDKQRLLFPRMQTFENRCPLFCRLRPLHPQQQTFLMVSPKVRSWRVARGNLTPRRS